MTPHIACNSVQAVRLVLWVGALAWLGCAGAQTQASKGQDEKPPVDYGAQRQVIDAERARAVAGFEAESAACQARFAVTDCQLKVQARRRVVESQYRREVTLINEAERQERVVQQRQATAEKRADRAQRDVQNDPKERALQEQERQLDSAEKRQTHKEKLETPATERRAGAADKGGATPTAAQQAENRSAHEQKLEDARKRRERSEEERLKKGKPKPSLPVAP